AKGREESRQASTAGADSEKITPTRKGSGVGLVIVRTELQAPAPAEDVQRRSLVAETDRPGMRWHKRIAKAALVLVIIALGVLIYSVYRRQSVRTQSTQRPRSLAILPFRNLRPGADTDFLGFSLADAVITKLGYVSALTVRPSYAVEKYRNQPIDIP